MPPLERAATGQIEEPVTEPAMAGEAQGRPRLSDDPPHLGGAPGVHQDDARLTQDEGLGGDEGIGLGSVSPAAVRGRAFQVPQDMMVYDDSLKLNSSIMFAKGDEDEEKSEHAKGNGK